MGNDSKDRPPVSAVKPIKPVPAPTARPPLAPVPAAVSSKPAVPAASKPLPMGVTAATTPPIAAIFPAPAAAPSPLPVPQVAVAAPVPPVVPPAPVASAAPVAPPAPVAVPTVEPVAPPAPAPTAKVTPIRKDNFMDAMQNTTNETMKTMTGHAETAMNGGKQAVEQVATRTREAMEQGLKSMDELSALAKGNVEAMLASSKVATAGLEAIAQQVADFSRKSFEDTTAAARAMTTVKSPNELMQLQNDFAKTQFDRAVAEMSKLSETMVKLMGDVFEPVSNRAATNVEAVKSAVQPVIAKFGSPN